MTENPNTQTEASAPASSWVAATPTLFVILWSSGFIGAKFGLPYAEPFTFLGLRFLMVAGLMLAICVIFRAPWPSNWRLTGHIVIAGLLVQAIYLGGVFSSIHHGLPAGLSALITGLQPALTAAVAIPFLKETVSLRQWLGIVLGFGGIILVVADKLAVSVDSFTGLWLAAIALVGITAGTVYQKRFCGPMELRTGSVIQFSASAVVIWIFVYSLETREVEWTPDFMFAIGWLVIVLSIGAISLLMLLIKRGAATKVASLFYLVPPVTAVMAFLAFGETLSLAALAGMAATVVGVALITRN